MKHLNENILPSLPYEKKTISESGAKRWMLKAGFRLREYKKGVYMDGHERPDVRAYRLKFLEKLASYEP